MRKWVRRGMLGVAVAVAFALGLLLATGAPRSGVSVIGDDGPAILSAAGWSQALPVSSAGVVVVSVESWDKLQFIGDMARVCGRICMGEAGLVRVVDLSPGGARKLLYVNLSAWPADGETRDFACLARALEREVAQIGAPDGVAPCAGAVAKTRTRWALPFGLGLI